MNAENNPAPTPEPMDLLISTLPPRVLLDILKADDVLSRAVLQGFPVRVHSLAHQVVRLRLAREAEKAPELAKELYTQWMTVFADLMTQLNDPAYEPAASQLQALTTTYGAEVLEYGLMHAERPEVRDWSARLAEIRTVTRIVGPAPATAPTVSRSDESSMVVAELRGKISTLQQHLQTIEEANTALQRELNAVKHQSQEASQEEASLRKRAVVAEEHVEREQRRARKAEEELEALKKKLRQAQQEVAGLPPRRKSTVEAEVASLLQRALTLLQVPAEQPAKPVTSSAPSASVSAPPTPATQRPKGPVVTVPTPHGQQTYTVAAVVEGLTRNDETLIERVRDGLARLANQPVEERAINAELHKAGVPATILHGPLRPAVIDGSNVANMSPQSKGRLAYLEQIRRAAWEEGYFPVITVVDASLRHQIDQPDQLMEMIERGEIIMAPAGTSADELLIEEAANRHATLITNDRMADWPAAKAIEKRHVEADRNTVRLSNFHRTARWFPW